MIRLRSFRKRVFLLIFIISTSTQAQTWVGGGDVSNWNDPANWSTDPSLPAAGSNITIDGDAVTLSVSSLFSPADITITNGGSLDVATGGLIVTSDDIFITGSTSSLTISGGALRGGDNMIVTDGSLTLSSGQLELLGRPDFTGGTLDIQGGLLDLNGTGASDDLILDGTTFSMSGGTLENDQEIIATNGAAITVSTGTINNAKSFEVTDGSLNLGSASTLNMDANFLLTNTTADLSGTVDLTPGGDLSLFGTTVVNVYTQNLTMDDLVLNDDGLSSTVSIYGTLTAFDDLKFDENPPDDVAGDRDSVIVKNDGSFIIDDSFRDADQAEGGSTVHVESGGTAQIERIGGLTAEEAYGTVVSSEPGATVTMEGQVGLPVELIYFNAETKQSLVRLAWATAMEINNDYFDLMKSADGDKFQPIARIKGSGNTNELIEYEFTDIDVSPGIYFYKLKQVDFDGTSEFHSIITVRFAGDTNNEFIVYPNPMTSQKISIKTNVNVPSPVISIYSMDGELIFKSKLSSGSSWYLDKAQFNLENGTYFMKICEETSNIEIGSSRIKVID